MDRLREALEAGSPASRFCMLGRYREPSAWTTRSARAAPAPAAAPQPPHRHRPRRELLRRGWAFADGHLRWARLLLTAGRAVRLLRRLAGPGLRAGHGVRRLPRLGHRPLLRPRSCCSASSCCSREPHARRRSAWSRWPRLVGTVMVSYTKARAESIGVRVRVGFMERPERHDLPHRRGRASTCWSRRYGSWPSSPTSPRCSASSSRGASREAWIDGCRSGARSLRRWLLVVVPSLGAAGLPGMPSQRAWLRRWARAIAAHARGRSRAARPSSRRGRLVPSPIGDYALYLLADALARWGDLAAARAAARPWPSVPATAACARGPAAGGRAGRPRGRRAGRARPYSALARRLSRALRGARGALPARASASPEARDSAKTPCACLPRAAGAGAADLVGRRRRRPAEAPRGGAA